LVLEELICHPDAGLGSSARVLKRVGNSEECNRNPLGDELFAECLRERPIDLGKEHKY